MSATNSYNLELVEQAPKAIDALESFFDGFAKGLQATVEMATETGVAKFQASATEQQEAGLAVLKTAEELRDALIEVKKTYQGLQDL